MVKNECGHSQEGNKGINGFLVCYYYNFWVVVVKNGHGLLGHATQKSAVSQE